MSKSKQPSTEVTPDAQVDTKQTIDTEKATTQASIGETDAEKAQDAAGHPAEIKEEFRTETVGLDNKEPEQPAAAATLEEKGEGKDMVDQTEGEPKTKDLTESDVAERQAVIEGKLRTPNHQNRNYLD